MEHYPFLINFPLDFNSGVHLNSFLHEVKNSLSWCRAVQGNLPCSASQVHFVIFYLRTLVFSIIDNLIGKADHEAKLLQNV